ncbi:histidine phosphatase family protein [Tunturiibacter gelidoferens]|uniref:Broad specificity phosphatase PhoE n=1 Tax=Tunturiibacter gelidiferens TaxID=3069689 RepID=A0ACC5NV22_9BACT|nr:broad specificity phosphatase PhoE [Edaphobacter lichenicola]
MPARLTLLSHASTAATRLSAFPADEPLEDSTLANLTTLNWQPPRAHQILTAPELRTQQTAKALNLAATPTPELRDLHYRNWQGRTLADLHAEDPQAIAQWLTDPTSSPHEGESIASLVTRIAAWLDTVATEGTLHTIAITHPAVIRAAILHSLNAPPQSFWRIDIAPLTLTDLRHNGRTWTLRATAIPLASHDPPQPDHPPQTKNPRQTS